jgi:hypothetical protein
MLNEICPGTANAYIFEGLRCIYKREKGIWYKVTVPCNMCGECCKKAPENWWLERNEKGWCKYLRSHENDKYICVADIPFGCASGDYAEEDWCIVKWLRL